MTKLRYKKLVLSLFSLFFFILSPFLVFFSLGYRVDIYNQKLANTLTIRIETIPRSAQIWQNDRILAQNTPFEVKVLGNNLLSLEIRKDGFLTEKFLFTGPGENFNSVSPLFPFWLLPKEGLTLATFGSSNKSFQQTEKNNFNILKQEIFWTEEYKIPKQANSFDTMSTETIQVPFIQGYSINGMRKEIDSVEKLSNRKIENLRLFAISENSYWDSVNQWLLFEKNNRWFLLDLQVENFQDWKISTNQNESLIKKIEDQIKQSLENVLPGGTSNSESQNKNNPTVDKNLENSKEKSFKETKILTNPSIIKNNKIISIVRSAPNQFLILDNEQNLWAWDLDTFEWQFLRNDIQGLSFSQSPNNIWLLSKNSIYKLPNNFISLKDVLDIKPFRQNLFFLKDLGVKRFLVKDFTQGLIFQFNDQIWFNEDLDKSWTMLANKVLQTAISQDTIFWLDQNFCLYSYNSFLKQELFLGKIEEFDKEILNLVTENLVNFFPISLHYDETWKRLFVYSRDEVWTVRIDKDLQNNSIVQFFPQRWLEKHQCWTQLSDRFQFCLQKDSDRYLLKIYRNNNLW